MQFNNNDFGEIAKAIAISPYCQDFSNTQPSPPPAAYYLIDDSGDNLIDDNEDFLVTP